MTKQGINIKVVDPSNRDDYEGSIEKKFIYYDKLQCDDEMGLRISNNGKGNWKQIMFLKGDEILQLKEFLNNNIK